MPDIDHVVGVYRLMQGETAGKLGGFYSDRGYGGDAVNIEHARAFIN